MAGVGALSPEHVKVVVGWIAARIVPDYGDIALGVHGQSRQCLPGDDFILELVGSFKRKKAAAVVAASVVSA